MEPCAEPAPEQPRGQHYDSGLVSDGGAFAPGTAVVIGGIASEPELNGRWGTVRRFLTQKGRYEVGVDGRERAVCLRPSHVYIQAAPPGDLGTGGSFAVDIAPYAQQEEGRAPEAERRAATARVSAAARP